MGDIGMEIHEDGRGNFYIKVTYESEIIFSADGTADSLFHLFIDLLDQDKESEIRTDPFIMLGAFQSLVIALEKDFSRNIRRIIKKKSFKKIFEALGKTSIRES